MGFVKVLIFFFFSEISVSVCIYPVRVVKLVPRPLGAESEQVAHARGRVAQSVSRERQDVEQPATLFPSGVQLDLQRLQACEALLRHRQLGAGERLQHMEP